MSRVILFDGSCNFCHWSVQFIIKRDPNAHFVFAALESNRGQTLLQQYGISPDVDSIVLIENNQYFIQSTAALKIARHLQGLYPLLSLFVFVPRPIRDAMYRMLANYRYKWFGKRDRCTLPSPDERNRFLL